jgi:hypothetical protein
MPLLRELLIAAAVVAFLFVWVILLAKVWNAPTASRRSSTTCSSARAPA